MTKGEKERYYNCFQVNWDKNFIFVCGGRILISTLSLESGYFIYREWE